MPAHFCSNRETVWWQRQRDCVVSGGGHPATAILLKYVLMPCPLPPWKFLDLPFNKEMIQLLPLWGSGRGSICRYGAITNRYKKSNLQNKKVKSALRLHVSKITKYAFEDKRLSSLTSDHSILLQSSSDQDWKIWLYGSQEGDIVTFNLGQLNFFLKGTVHEERKQEEWKNYGSQTGVWTRDLMHRD